MRMRKVWVMRRRYSLASSAATFSACCREHGPRERTRAVLLALPFGSLGIYLANSVFAAMPAVYFALSSH